MTKETAADKQADTASQRSEGEKQVTTLYKQYSAAYLKGDRSSLADILADDWTLITAKCGGVRNKPGQLQELERGILKVEAIDDSEVKCRVYGDAAVVIGRRKSKVIYNKRDVSDVTRFSQFYVRREGKWRCVSTQVTSIADEASEYGH